MLLLQNVIDPNNKGSKTVIFLKKDFFSQYFFCIKVHSLCTVHILQLVEGS